MSRPRRYLKDGDLVRCRPVNVVWELTLACDLKCVHCGSRAGHARPSELNTAECLALVQQLADLGAREVALIGGEAYLRPDWTEIVRAIRKLGMDCSLQTGGRNLTEKRIAAAAAAGLQGAGVSIDGLAPLHDYLRGVAGSFDKAILALRRLKAHGIVTSVNTQITAPVVDQLDALFEEILGAGVSSWQIALTVPMGRAADRPDLLLQPYQLLDLMPRLAEIHRRGYDRGLILQPSNNIGYFGPFESLWRCSDDSSVYFSGCNAGQNLIGIEADGSIKGCPGLPGDYIGGNVRVTPLREIWESSQQLGFTRQRTSDELWGFCRDCYYADVCLGGCTWMAHTLLGRRGNNPYCHHRTLQLAERGLRERVAKTREAPGRPFDYGQFELIVEPLDAPAAPSHAQPSHPVEPLLRVLK
jgi:radical SAM protein with 4Fe4S-binding SPASM domain